MANLILKKSIPLILALAFLILAGYINSSFSKPIFTVSKQQSAINLSDKLVKLFSLGQKRLISNIIWITTLIESDIEHYKKNDLNSWIYLRFKTLFEMDPKFLFGYQFAGKYLSIVKDDLIGAKEIFEQGLSHYPNDYQLNFDAGFLYGFELQDYNKAKKAYEIAIQDPKAPDFLKSIIHKFDYEITQNKELTFKLLFGTYSTLPEDSHLKKKMKIDLYALKAQTDLDCLNSENKNKHCSKIDFFGNNYLRNKKGYYSKYPFENYELKTKSRNQLQD